MTQRSVRRWSGRRLARQPASKCLTKWRLLSWLKAELSVENQTNAEGPRVSGLGKGMWQVSDDFDAPLPDEFWLGRDA